MATPRDSSVLWTITFVIAVCFASFPVQAQYDDDSHVLQAHKEDFETGDFSKFSWSSYGDVGWDTTVLKSHSGSYCVKSGSIQDSESSKLEVTIGCSSGDITFYYKVSSELHSDNLVFKIDGVEKGTWSGEEDWAEVSFPVDEGTRTFKWVYSKNRSISSGSDAAWIDDIVFPIKSNSDPIDEIPDGRYFIEAGELRATLEYTEHGLTLASLFDLATGTEFMGPSPKSRQIFRICLRDTEGDEEPKLWAERGWNQARIEPTGDLSWLVTFESPTDSRFTGTRVTMPIRVEPGSNSLHLGLQVRDVPEPWAVKKVHFPELKIVDSGPQMRILVPQGSGRLLDEGSKYEGLYGGFYPGSSSASMTYIASYDSSGKAGLYVGTHDPWASNRGIIVKGEGTGELHGIVLSFQCQAPNSDQPGNGFDFSGEAVLQLFRGDWYDATLIYRDWVWANAKWYPKLSENGREDTPLWMKELPIWIRTHNHTTIEDDVSWAKQFTNYVRVPTGLRWHMWYEAPKPHLFPAKPGFREAIIELKNQRFPVHVMPYTLGTYWPVTADGIEDFYISNDAFEGTVKNIQGEPHSLAIMEINGILTYRFAMCPASDFWKQFQKDIVLRTINELDAKAVYMDAIGDLTAIPCFDQSHNHPIGGGSWWARSNWELIEDIRRVMPPDCILTTESSCEAYVHVFDGFLGKWDWDRAVPAFPAIYGGAIQVCAQDYDFHEKPTMILAHRMQAGRALVFGAQIANNLRLPKILWVEETMQFIAQIVQLRWVLRRFFYAGRMARPPKLYGDIPTVTADRGGHDPNTWMTSDAVLTGAWKIPHEQRLVLLFVNVSDRPLVATFDFDAERYGLPSGELTGTVIVSPTADQEVWARYHLPSIPGEPLPLAYRFQRILDFPPRLAWAWIIEPQ